MEAPLIKVVFRVIIHPKNLGTSIDFAILRALKDSSFVRRRHSTFHCEDFCPRQNRSTFRPEQT